MADEEEYIKPRKIGLINGETKYVTLPSSFGEKGQYVSIEWVREGELRVRLI